MFLHNENINIYIIIYDTFFIKNSFSIVINKNECYIKDFQLDKIKNSYFENADNGIGTINDIYKNMDYYMRFLPSWRIEKIKQMKQKELQFSKLLLSLSLYMGIKDLIGVDLKNEEVSHKKTKPNFIKTLNGDMNIYFNLSDTSNIVASAIKSSNIGIDVECIEKTYDIYGLSKRFYSKDEYKMLREITDENLLKKLFISLWTMKEAYGKYKGDGIVGAINFDFSDVIKNELLDKYIKKDDSMMLDMEVQNFTNQKLSIKKHMFLFRDGSENLKLYILEILDKYLLTICISANNN